MDRDALAFGLGDARGATLLRPGWRRCLIAGLRNGVRTVPAYTRRVQRSGVSSGRLAGPFDALVAACRALSAYRVRLSSLRHVDRSVYLSRSLPLRWL